MQECMEQQQQSGGARGMLPQNLHRQNPGLDLIRRSTSDSDLNKDSNQPAEAEYLSARCVLFTYFRGEIGDVVDEHFSRALSQASSFNSESKPIRVTQPSASSSTGLWKDGASSLESQSNSVWTTSCPSQPSSCVPPSVHPDYSSSSSPVSFSPDASLWTGHVFSQTNLPPPTTLPDTWTTYSLSPSSSSGYPNVHDVYHPHSHPHMHPRHPHHPHHPMLHSYPTHTATLDPRFSPLLLPSVRTQSSASSSPLSDVKIEMDASSPNTPVTWAPTTLHGPLEVYDSAQTKANKASIWY